MHGVCDHAHKGFLMVWNFMIMNVSNLMFAALLFVESIIDLFRVFFLNIAYDDVSGLNIV